MWTIYENIKQTQTHTHEHTNSIITKVYTVMQVHSNRLIYSITSTYLTVKSFFFIISQCIITLFQNTSEYCRNVYGISFTINHCLKKFSEYRINFKQKSDLIKSIRFLSCFQIRIFELIVCYSVFYSCFFFPLFIQK